MLQEVKKTSKIKENACFIFASFGDREIRPRQFYAVKLKDLLVLFFFRNLKMRLRHVCSNVQQELLDKSQLPVYESERTVQKSSSFLKVAIGK